MGNTVSLSTYLSSATMSSGMADPHIPVFWKSVAVPLVQSSCIQISPRRKDSPADAAVRWEWPCQLLNDEPSAGGKMDSLRASRPSHVILVNPGSPPLSFTLAEGSIFML